ncbi:hypothetical protein Tco_0839861 [Tanacetum coccineum]|uniref:Uncharacterized protein n=1 Tax=Tanacetum coccineum TaxID=301880 RepID=A0ABQ5AWC6_9ASTR
MGYLVRAYYNISRTRYYKDDLCWSADLKSKTTEDIISIGSFMEVLVLNHYVLVRKILFFADSGESYKHYLLVSFDMINHRFQVIDIPDLVMRGLLLSVDGGSITSALTIMTMPSNHFLKLLGFNNHDLPIVEATTGHIMGHMVQVYMGNSQSFENVAIQGIVGSFFVGPNKESLILAAHPDHSLYCAG